MKSGSSVQQLISFHGFITENEPELSVNKNRSESHRDEVIVLAAWWSNNLLMSDDASFAALDRH